ncbi:MAG: tRNA pseudouridine(38-40) synthase TruA [Kofleriaceae bacterium]
MRHIRIVVEYDGTDLSGWQRQANGPTVQGHLETALAQLLQHATPVVGASRTDAGVHARGQVASFRTERTIPLHGIRRGLNSMLPDTIAIREATEVGDDFHPRFSATGKHYRYRILARPDRSPLLRLRSWLLSDPIEVAAMQAGAAALVGIHDFAAFRAAGCAAKTTIRRIDEVRVEQVGDEVIVDVRGNAFLRNMVRILAGTLAEIGTGARLATEVPEIIASRDRVRAGITAPAHGLELIEVRYDGTRVPRV